MNESEIAYILSRIVDNAKDSLDDAAQNPKDDFYAGKKFAYYEMLDTIKNELIARGADLEDFGLAVDLEKLFL